MLVPTKMLELPTLAEFAASMDECDLVELNFLILSDKWFMDLVNENYRLELQAPEPRSTPDEIARATMESLSHGDKCALRNRVLNERHWQHVADANEERAIRARIRAQRTRP
jgi:hypothetical protein